MEERKESHSRVELFETGYLLEGRNKWHVDENFGASRRLFYRGGLFGGERGSKGSLPERAWRKLRPAGSGKG